MNKFLIIKCKDVNSFNEVKHNIANYALSSLSFNPTHVRVQPFESQLILACSFELANSGGFEKRYTYTYPNSFFAFDGMPLFTSLEPNKSWAKQINDLWTTDEIALNHIFGTWAGIRVNKQGVRALSDFTGMTPIFYCKNDRFIAISTRQTLLNECVLFNEPDINALGWLLAQSNIIGNEMPIKGIVHLPPSHTLLIDGTRGSLDHKIIERELYVDKRMIKNNYSISSSELDEAAHSLICQANSVAKLPVQSFKLDITGGLDSRLVLAIALNSNMKDKVSYLQTKGPENSFEIQVGKSIADKVNIPHRAISPPSTKQQPYFNHQRTIQQIISRIRFNSFRYEGSLCLSDANVPNSLNSQLVICGAAGEIYRRHCKPHMKLHISSKEQFLEAYKDYHQKTDPLGIMHDEVKSYYQTQLQQIALSFINNGAELNDVSDIFFMKYRLPLWNGIIGNNLYSNVKIYPLVNYNVGKLAFSAGYNYRVSDRIHFELMLKLAPHLAAHPFLKYTWPDSFQNIAERKGIKLASSSFKTVGKPSLAQRNLSISKVASTGLNTFHDYLKSYSDSRIWEIISKDKLYKRIKQDTNLSLTEMKELFAAIGTTCFLEKDFDEKKDGKKIEFKRDGALANLLFPTNSALME